MSSADPQSNQESEDTQDEDNNATVKQEEANAEKNDEEWDGNERRSKDRPWSDVDNEKESAESILSEEERDALSGDCLLYTSDAADE